MRSRVRATLLGLAVLGSGTWAQAQCSKDIDCKGDRVCNAGQCTAPPAAPAPAESQAPSAAQASPAAAATPAAAAPVVQPPVAAPVASPPPLAAPLPKPKMHRRSPPLMVTGIVLTSAGPLVWLLGLSAVASAERNCLRDASVNNSTFLQASDLNDCRTSARTGSNVVWIAGTVLLAVGAPLIVYGAKKVADSSVTASVVPVLAPGHAGLQLRVDL